jgi:hypothetical protein
LLEGKKKRRLQIEYPDSVSIKRGLFFSTITVTQEDGGIVIDRLAEGTAKQARAFLHAAYLTEHHFQAVDLLAQLETALKDRYMRTSYWQELQADMVKLVEPWLAADRSLLSVELRAPFDKLAAMVDWTEKDLANLQRQHLANCLKRFKTFFDSVESPP